MDAAKPKDFKHTTLDHLPKRVEGVTLLDEDSDYTGVYFRDSKGGLFPARTVYRGDPVHHESVCAAWMRCSGKNLDLRRKS
jgi:hypothetical protein